MPISPQEGNGHLTKKQRLIMNLNISFCDNLYHMGGVESVAPNKEYLEQERHQRLNKVAALTAEEHLIMREYGIPIFAQEL